MRPGSPSSLLVGLALIGGSSASLGCERKAPGPEECARFSEMVEQLSGSGPLLTPEIQEQVDELTRQCLTKPYDRALLACVERTHQTHGCLESFRLRTEPHP